MSFGPIKEASQYLIGHWLANTRTEHLPPDLRPETRADAYKIQALIQQQSSRPLVAWKLAATSLAGQKHIGVSGPLVGRYIAERVVSSGDVVPFGNNGMKVAEIEFAFRFGKDIAPRSVPYEQDEILQAVASLHPAIEIPDSRYEHFERVGEAALIADNACANWLCIGAASPGTWHGLDLAAFSPTGEIAGRSPVQGKGSNVLGSPLLALAWFVNELSSLGQTIRRDQVVSTGTCVIPMAISPGDRVIGNFGELGRVEVTLGH